MVSGGVKEGGSPLLSPSRDGDAAAPGCGSPPSLPQEFGVGDLFLAELEHPRPQVVSQVRGGAGRGLPSVCVPALGGCDAPGTLR